MIDTSETFLSVDSMKDVVNVLSANKYNVLRWKFAGAAGGFPLQSALYPNLTQFGSTDHRRRFSRKDTFQLVMYARRRGIFILPEFDPSTDLGYAWDFWTLWGEPLYVQCDNCDYGTCTQVEFF